MPETLTRQIQKAIYNKLVETMPTYFTSLSLSAPRIKMGNLQDDPEDVSASFMIHLQDPDDMNWRDEAIRASSPEPSLYSQSSSAHYGRVDNQLFTAGRIGGGRSWAKKFTVEIIQFCPNKTQDQAADLALAVADFTVEKLREVQISTLSDGLKEGVRLVVDSIRYEEGGGPPTDYNWTTYIRVIAEILDKKA